jgi:hypothetical protein
MTASSLGGGIATAIGSLPHRDAQSAAALSLRTLPDLPAAPQLPNRSALEGMLVQWLRGLPEIHVRDDGSYTRDAKAASDGPVDTTFDPLAHGGLLGFLDLAAAQPRVPPRVKLQLTGPLTLGVALTRLGVPAHEAFERGAQCSRAWARALARLTRQQLPAAELVLFFDEPGLVAFNDDDPPIDVETASDLLSGALAAPECTVGVHVCGDGSLGVALSAGPDIVGVDVHTRVVPYAAALSRFYDSGGFIAWGAVPTDRPIGEGPAPLWKALVELWCEITRRGCDPVRIRQQSLVTPACGLAEHGVTQAERALRLARELAARVSEQACATRLTVGA